MTERLEKITEWNNVAWKKDRLTPLGDLGEKTARKLSRAYDLLRNSEVVQKGIGEIETYINQLMESAENGKPTTLNAGAIVNRFLPNKEPSQYGASFINSVLPGYLHEGVYNHILHACQAPEPVRSQIRVLLGAETYDIPPLTQLFDGVKLMWETTPIFTQDPGDIKPTLSDLLITVAPKESAQTQDALRSLLKTQQMRTLPSLAQILYELSIKSRPQEVLEKQNMNRIYFAVGLPINFAEITFFDTANKPMNTREVIKKITMAIGASNQKRSGEIERRYTRVKDRKKMRDLIEKGGFNIKVPSVGAAEKVAIYRPKGIANTSILFVVAYSEQGFSIKIYPSQKQIETDRVLLIGEHIKKELMVMAKEEISNKGNADNLDPDKITTNFICRFTRQQSIRARILDTISLEIPTDPPQTISGVDAIRMLAYEVVDSLKN